MERILADKRTSLLRKAPNSGSLPCSAVASCMAQIAETMKLSRSGTLKIHLALDGGFVAELAHA